MLPSNLLLEILKTVFNSRFLTKILYTLYLSYELSHITLLVLITIVTSEENLK